LSGIGTYTLRPLFYFFFFNFDGGRIPSLFRRFIPYTVILAAIYISTLLRTTYNVSTEIMTFLKQRTSILTRVSLSNPITSPFLIVERLQSVGGVHHKRGVENNDNNNTIFVYARQDPR